MYTYRNGIGWYSTEWLEATAGTADRTEWLFQDATGLLLAKEDAEGKQLTYTYATGGKLETRTWARLDSGNPIITTYSYHPQTAELTGIDYSDATPGITFTYDRLGQPETITDAVGTRTFTYNDYNQLETETITGLYNESITRTYEQTGVPGRASGFTFGADYQINYGYDSTGRFNTVSWNVNGSSNSATYTYHTKADLITKMTVTGTAADYTASYTYHPKRNFKQRVENRYGTTLISSYYSPVDELSRRNATITSGSAFVTIPEAFNLYDYNDRSELIESARYEGTDLADLTAPITDEYRQYIFDNIGNREEATESAETGIYTTNSLNQYTDLTKGPQTETFTHDDDGNLISRTTDGKTILYSFNGENRLITIEPQTPESGDIKVTMLYDYMGRRVEKKTFNHNGSDWTEDYTKHFLYDGWNLVKETTTENSITTATYYTWGLDLSQSLQGAGGIGGLIVTVSDTDTNYHCYDLNGNKTQLIAEANGTITAHIEYDPFGNEVTSYGLSSADDPFRFSTKYNDPEYNLYYYGYRYYVPDLGRWLTRDPIGEDGGLNVSIFLKNDSLNNFDVYGLLPRRLPSNQDYKSCHVCGPEVSEALNETLRNVTKEFKNLHSDGKDTACSLGQLLGVWDIYFPRNSKVGHFNRCATGKCADTVSVKGICYDLYKVNYILFGHISSLCEWHKSKHKILIFLQKNVRKPLDQLFTDEEFEYEYTEDVIGWAEIGRNLEIGNENLPSSEKFPKPTGKHTIKGCSSCKDTGEPNCEYQSAFKTSWPGGGVRWTF